MLQPSRASAVPRARAAAWNSGATFALDAAYTQTRISLPRPVVSTSPPPGPLLSRPVYDRDARLRDRSAMSVAHFPRTDWLWWWSVHREVVRMAWSPTTDAGLDVAERAAALLRDCRGLAALGWPESLVDRSVAASERLADDLAGLGQAELRARTLELGSFLAGMQQAPFPTPGHAAELARVTEHLGELLGDVSGPRVVDLLTARGATPPALAQAFAGAGWTLRRHADTDALADAARRTPAAALL